METEKPSPEMLAKTAQRFGELTETPAEKKKREARERRQKAHGLTQTRWTARGFPGIYQQCYALRVELETEAVKVFGKISIEQASLINLAVRLETHAKVLEQRMNKGGVEKKDLLVHSKLVADLTSRRHTAIRRLGLTGAKIRPESADDWDEVDAMLGGENDK